ncbi:MAG: hypothetical protein ACE5HO_17930 [bacterium]
MFATGDVANHRGQANFRARREIGDLSGSLLPLFGLEPVGLLDPHGAEVHMIVRSHGPAIPGKIDEQIGSFDGGCTAFLDPPEVPDEVGECADIQFSVHQP